MAKKRIKPARLEFTYDAAAPMWKELATEAQLRDTSLQQHIEDLLQSRYNIRHGRQSVAELLWVPGPSQPQTETLSNEPSDAGGARDVADQWM